jgi:hypothetical protein|tara:strand:- start:450 stop:1049 length:600 start_codon:yes stop_codon:yes gene_type:complete
MSLTIHGTEGKLTGLPVGGLPNGTVTAANIADNTLTRAKCTDIGEDIQHVHFQSGKIDEWQSQLANITYTSFSVPRQSDDDGIVFMGWIPLAGEESYRCGEYIHYNGTNKYDKSAKIASWNNDSNDGIFGFVMYQGADQASSLGTHKNLRVKLGHSSRSGSNERCGAFHNPGMGRSADRHRNRTTQIHFLECDNLTIVS